MIKEKTQNNIDRTNDVKIILVTRKTRLEELVSQYNTEDQAHFVIKSRGGDFEDYRLEHNTYLQSITNIMAELKRFARVQRIEREFLSNFVFGPTDIIIVLGQDGLVANTLKYLNGQPVIAINPEPTRFDGVLLPFKVSETKSIIRDVIRGTFNVKHITMAKAAMNDGQELIAVNDLFIGPKYQISARYELSIGKRSEIQSSSGIIISTGLGSTGWMKSVFAGAIGVTGKSKNQKPMEWDADYLQFAVREPFPSQITGTDLVFGEINQQSMMTISSRMTNNGVIFSDGMIDDYIDFNSGTIGVIGISEKKGIIVH